MIRLKGFFDSAYDEEGFVDVLGINAGGGKGGGTVTQPVYTPPPAAPAVEEAATLEGAVTPEEEAKRKTEATKSGAKSLQIPVTSGAESSGTVGTGQ